MVQKQLHESQRWQVSLTTTKIGEFDVKNSREKNFFGAKRDTKLSLENLVLSFAKRQAKNYMYARITNWPLMTSWG